MRRRLMILSEKVFLLKSYYTNGEDWMTVQEEFHNKFDVQTSQEIEALIHQIVKRFETTGSVAHDFYFGPGMIIKRNILDKIDFDNIEIIPEKKKRKYTKRKHAANETPTIIEPTTEVKIEIEVETEPMYPTAVATTDYNTDTNDQVDTGHSAHSTDDKSSGEEPDFLDPRPRPYACKDCSWTFRNRTDLSKHRQVYHKPEPEPRVMCPTCSKMIRPKNLQAHLKTHIPLSVRLEQVPEKCSVCEKPIIDMKRHIKRCHFPDRRNKHICDLCGKALVSSNCLKRHMLTHTQEKPFKCTECPKAFATRHCQILHHRVHTNSRPYKCPTCEKAFRDNSTLRVHLLQHTGETPYVCPICGKRCKQAQNLRSHIRHIHTKGPVLFTASELREGSQLFQENL